MSNDTSHHLSTLSTISEESKSKGTIQLVSAIVEVFETLFKFFFEQQKQIDELKNQIDELKNQVTLIGGKLMSFQEQLDQINANLKAAQEAATATKAEADQAIQNATDAVSANAAQDANIQANHDLAQ